MGSPLLIEQPSTAYRLIDLVHRWLGGVFGVLLVVLAVSGTILAHKDAWVTLPHARDAQVQDTEALIATVERVMADPQTRPRSIIFASQNFGLNRLSFEGQEEAGAYTDQSGELVTRWESKWERPEVWLFELHHHLLSGDTGEMVAGIVGVAGLVFVASGVFLWWRLRSGYEFRLWPRRFSRPAILRHHRDMGIVLAPLLALTLVTGTTMIFRPVAGLVLGPGVSAEVAAALKAPIGPKSQLPAQPDWRGMIETARRLYPDAEVRILARPAGKGGLVSLRVRQPEEWLPNGRTTLWFKADTGALVEARDARAMAPRVQAYNALYPLHAAKVGGLPYRLVVTLSGVAMTVLGGLTIWTFWFRRKAKPKRRGVAAVPA